MDLGFGAANQAVGETASKAILATQMAQEAALNERISEYDALLEASDDTLEAIRARRLAQLRRQNEQHKNWRNQGHGTYSALVEGQHGGDCTRAFFEASKASKRLVVHFHRPTTRLCDIFHRHLKLLADRHLETRFVSIDVESGSADFLVEKLGIVIMPTLLLVMDRKAIHHVRGFDELGATEHFATRELEFVLATHGIIFPREDADDEEELQERLLSGGGVGGGRSVNSIRLKDAKQRAVRSSAYQGYDNECADDE